MCQAAPRRSPSSLLMAAVPRVAGVARIIVAVTPPDRASNRVPDVILAAAALPSVDRLWAVGGAQAISLLPWRRPPEGGGQDRRPRRYHHPGQAPGLRRSGH
ncbi:histidinol dehydrogenase [Candidatus Amarolinea dominans]|uniref:histidinol dehydrogenase n=1 Tax=Candidatus Amarolinea dominans TaxID=3140696 RepID=UPI0031CC83B7